MKSSLAGFVALVLVVAGCSSSDGDGGADDATADEAETTTTTILTADLVLSNASDAMAGIDSVAFTIEHVGADVFIDDDGLIGFEAANGRYAAPSSAEAIVAVNALGISTEIGAVAIDGQIWITNPLTGRWEEGPEALTFDPAQIFDDTVGISGLLADGFTQAELASVDPDVEGRYEVSGAVDPERVSDLTGGLVDDVSDATVWVDAETSRVDEISFDVEIDGSDSSWRLVLDDYGVDVTITMPDLG